MTERETKQLDTLLSAVCTLAPLIRAHADDAEQQRRLPQPVVTALADAGLFRMLIPQALGGLEVPPLTLYRVVEEVARIDGSTGWCLMIGATTAVVGAYLPDPAPETIFRDNSYVALAGAVFPHGRAVAADGGYLVSGRWPFASGCQHSSWFVAFCNVFTPDHVRLAQDDSPEVRVVQLPASKILILDTWDVSGLAGTGSHDVVIEQVFVPEEYTWTLGPGMRPVGRYYQGPLYRYPFMGSFAFSIGAVALGIAQAALDAGMELAQVKRPAGGREKLCERPLFQVQMADAVALVRSARTWLHAAVEQAWESTIAKSSTSFNERADLLLAAAHAVQSSAIAVNLVYTAAGGSANYRGSLLQRCLRDVHAATQHLATGRSQYETAGRMLLGLQPRHSLILS